MASKKLEEISSACEAAAQALQAIGNIGNADIQNLAASTASSDNSVASTSTTNGGDAIATELARRFPTYNSRGRRPSGNVVGRSRTRTLGRKRRSNSREKPPESDAKSGRPAKSICHKDLVIIPNPYTKQVPSHSSKVKLEERGLIIHKFPFDRRWSPVELRENIERQLPRDVLFQFMKACYGTLVIPKLADGVQMNGERIIKFSGQGSVYIRCLDPLEEEDNDEEDEQLLHSAFFEKSDDSDHGSQRKETFSQICGEATQHAIPPQMTVPDEPSVLAQPVNVCEDPVILPSPSIVS
ncbi:uncharacterized protein LOC114530408 [Dendronephthya gigantea]|uniref:uncharacterized protein LOC114530408 n=1 Tax=Dendronephthya gigantea TaxID=151771 RepID=UPI0010693C0E|nr:uncharacterized protein LOC114530408 [Dendronephthya gigantea]